MIHRYKSNGYNIVLDVNSGLVHVTDQMTYDMIGLMEDMLRGQSFGVENKTEKETEAEKTTGTEKLESKNSETPKASEILKNTENREQILRQMSTFFEDEKKAFVYRREAESSIDEANVKEVFSELYDELLGMVEEESLFSEDAYEPYIEHFKKRETVVKALCLHIAHDCNLACRYCFAEEGEYHGRRALMTEEVGKRALEFLVEASGSRTNLEVDFFGGEPLMNFEVVKELVRYGRELEAKHNKKFRFTLTTNGVLLNDEVMEFANREMNNVVLSIDGRKEVNDRMRPFRNGAGSYDLIVPKFKKLADSRNQTNYYVRGTFTHNNLDFCEDVKHLAELGFQQISVEPVVARDTDSYAIREEDIPQILSEYDKLAEYILKRRSEGKWFNFFHFMIDLNGGPCVAKRLSGCGSGTEYLAVTPWGDLYPCHQFVGEEEFKMGTVFEGVTNTKLREQFRKLNVYAKEKCKDCFARFFCSGGCAANSYKFHGRIDDAYDIGCKMQQKRVECALMIKAAEAE